MHGMEETLPPGPEAALLSFRVLKYNAGKDADGNQNAESPLIPIPVLYLWQSLLLVPDSRCEGLAWPQVYGWGRAAACRLRGGSKTSCRMG